uniref:Uncharacterized protein n=1 Tax=Arundo donax TaxID=35708 RepID=A0A0A9HVQ1_ARUDO
MYKEATLLTTTQPFICSSGDSANSSLYLNPDPLRDLLEGVNFTAPKAKARHRSLHP